MAFRMLLGLDLLTTAVLAWFFFGGLSDGSVAAENWDIWAALAVALAIVFGSALILRRAGWPRLANLVLALPAAPLLLYSLLLLFVAIWGEAWD